MKKLIGILFLFGAMGLKAQYVRPSDANNGAPTGPSSQTPPKGMDDNFSVGGSFALQFGSTTFIELEPLLNYHVGKSFIAGIGPIYQYLNVQDPYYGNYIASTYGARVAALYFLPEDLSRVFIMGEYDIINVPEPSLTSYRIDRGYLGLPMLGIGYKEPVSDKVFFCIYGLWNFNNSIYNPFANPIINVGFDIGLWR